MRGPTIRPDVVRRPGRMRDVRLSAGRGEVPAIQAMAGGATAPSSGFPAGGSSRSQLTASGAGGVIDALGWW
jgi:hypothetical protein